MSTSNSSNSAAPGDATTREVQDLLARAGNASVGYLVIRGIVALVFGLLVLFSPRDATAVLTPFIGFVLAFWLIAGGVVEIVAAVRSRDHFSGWGWDVFFGAVAALAGVVLLFRPVDAGFFFVMLLLWLLAFVVLFRSAQLFSQGRFWAIALGVVYVILAVVMLYLLFAHPAEWLVAVVWVAGIWGVVSGVGSFLLAWQLQAARRSIATATRGSRPTTEDA